jgi:hypothetical protein
MLVGALIFSNSISANAQSATFGIKWPYTIGVTNNVGVLTKTNQTLSWSNGGGFSSNILPANMDGWIEFTLHAGDDYIVGLSYNNLLNFSEFNYAIYVTSQSIYYREGTGSAVISTFQTNDLIRIAREGSSVKYYKNGTVVRTVTVSPAEELKVKTTIYKPGKSSPLLTSSFDARLEVMATIEGTESNVHDGSIALNVTGGDQPYTFAWQTGESTSAISNKPVGSYSVTVTDAAGRTDTKSYRIGYQVNWSYTTGLQPSGHSLVKTTASGPLSNAGANSNNIIPANQDGWIEFTALNGDDFMAGFGTTAAINYNQFTHGFSIDDQTGSVLAYQGSSSYALGNFQTGDVFRIARVGSIINFYRNNQVLRTVSVNPALELKPKACVQNQGKRIPSINVSSDYRLIVVGAVTGTNGSNSLGKLAISVAGGAEPYSVQWESGETSTQLDNKSRGSYSVVARDARNHVLDRKYGLGYAIDWTNVTGATLTNGVITKNSNTVNSGAVSSNILPANTDGWIEFSAINGTDYFIGFATYDTYAYGTFAHAFSIDSSTGTCLSYVGTGSVSLGSFQNGDVFRIAREGSLVKYYKNGLVLRTVSSSPGITYKVKVFIETLNQYSPLTTASFWKPAVPQTYYAIANGDWTNPSNWSLSPGGAAANAVPDELDTVVISGYEITITGSIVCSYVNIKATNGNTRLLIDGGQALLTVKGTLAMTKEYSDSTVEVLTARNDGRIVVIAP